MRLAAEPQARSKAETAEKLCACSHTAEMQETFYACQIAELYLVQRRIRMITAHVDKLQNNTITLIVDIGCWC